MQSSCWTPFIYDRWAVGLSAWAKKSTDLPLAALSRDARCAAVSSRGFRTSRRLCGGSSVPGLAIQISVVTMISARSVISYFPPAFSLLLIGLGFWHKHACPRRHFPLPHGVPNLVPAQGLRMLLFLLLCGTQIPLHRATMANTSWSRDQAGAEAPLTGVCADEHLVV